MELNDEILSSVYGDKIKNVTHITFRSKPPVGAHRKNIDFPTGLSITGSFVPPVVWSGHECDRLCNLFARVKEPRSNVFFARRRARVQIMKVLNTTVLAHVQRTADVVLVFFFFFFHTYYRYARAVFTVIESHVQRIMPTRNVSHPFARPPVLCATIADVPSARIVLTTCASRFVLATCAKSTRGEYNATSREDFARSSPVLATFNLFFMWAVFCSILRHRRCRGPQARPDCH